MRRLAVEDLRIYAFECTYARTLDEAERLLFGEPWDEVWLDYDMGGIWGSNGIDTGEIVREMAARARHGDPLPIGRVVIVSANPEGRAAQVSMLAGLYPLIEVVGNDYAVGFMPTMEATA